MSNVAANAAMDERIRAIDVVEFHHRLKSEAVFTCGLVLTLLGLLYPLWLYLELPEAGEFRTSTVFALGVVEYCAVRLALISLRGQPQLLDLSFYVFIYVWGGLTPFAQTHANIFPWLVRHNTDQATLGMLQIVLALFAYEVGQIYALRRPHSAGLHAITVELSLKLVIRGAIMAIPLCLLGMMLGGGTDLLFTTRTAFDTIARKNTGSKAEFLIAINLFHTSAFVAFVLTATFCVRKWRFISQATRRTGLGVLLITAVLHGIANFPPSLARQWFGTILLAPAFGLLPWRRWMAAMWSLGLVTLVVFVYPYSDMFRSTFKLDFDALDRTLHVRVVDQILSKGDFDVYQQTLNAIGTTERIGLSFGKNFLGAALFWFPRSAWSGKPDGTGQLVARENNYPWHQTNLSSPLWMEGYWAFGWVGIIFVMGAYGYFCKRIQTSYIASLRRTGSLELSQIFVPFLAGFQFILLRGDILNAAATSMLVIVMFLATARLRIARQPAGNTKMQESHTF